MSCADGVFSSWSQALAFCRQGAHDHFEGALPDRGISVGGAMKHQPECTDIHPAGAQCPSLALEVPLSGAPLNQPVIPFVEKESTCAINTTKPT